MASTDYSFEGWLGKSPEAVQGKMEWGAFEPKKWTEDDVDIEITHCGICGSDCHTLRSGWGETRYPCVVGHEIVGRAVRVGSNVGHISVGDRVGVGAQARSCMRPTCAECSAGRPNVCGTRGESVHTYNSAYPGDEGEAYGGYADYNRTNGGFVVKIPEGLPSEAAAPMLCGGVTVYAPLKRHGCGPGKTVGIVGVGGLGHFGVLFAKALGADRVVGISRKESKRADVLALGADDYIATGEGDDKWHRTHGRTLDLIVSTVSDGRMPLRQYLMLLKTGGTFVQVGNPDGGEFPRITTYQLLSSEVNITGSSIGSPAEIKEMLQLAVDKKVRPWVETRPMKDANQAVLDFEAGKPRFRFVLVNEKHVQSEARL